MTIAASIILLFAVIPTLLFIWNLFLYRAPAPPCLRDSVSILIPARNEERSIEASVRAALASEGIEIEVIVLDDHSQDRTKEIVGRLAAEDKRLRLYAATPLPIGWCGKQHACSLLAEYATKPVLCFIDADVLLRPRGVALMAAELRRTKAGLISGFPYQITRSTLEQLLLPLMHFLLLGFLPIIAMRRSPKPAFGAGCGQLFVADRAAYRRAGGHATIRSSRHDGITLPKAFRRAGIHTDLCDATTVASCRMYQNSHDVFFGLLKNADEGLAAPSRILPFSAVLLIGQFFPILAFLYSCIFDLSPSVKVMAGLATAAAYLPRLLAAWRFRQPWFAAVFHPLATLMLLGIQWYALLRLLSGKPATWKGRSYSAT